LNVRLLLIPSLFRTQNLLVVSTINETRILDLGNEEEAEIEELDTLGRFDLSRPTLLACSCNGSAYQVTSSGVVGDSSNWAPPQDGKITLAASYEAHILLSASGGDVYLLDVSDASSIQQVSHVKLEQEVACLDLSSLGNNGLSLVAAVGLWNTYSVVLFNVPDLKQIDNIEVGTTFLLRSVMSVSLANDHGDSTPHLFIGLGDGSLISYSYRQGSAASEVLDRSSRKSVTLGSRPLTLAKFHTAGNQEAGLPSLPAVLAISDRSTVVSATGGKLVFSSVNTKVSIASDISFLEPS
jgi:hypothetical protein